MNSASCAFVFRFSIYCAWQVNHVPSKLPTFITNVLIGFDGCSRYRNRWLCASDDRILNFWGICFRSPQTATEYCRKPQSTAVKRTNKSYGLTVFMVPGGRYHTLSVNVLQLFVSLRLCGYIFLLKTRLSKNSLQIYEGYPPHTAACRELNPCADVQVSFSPAVAANLDYTDGLAARELPDGRTNFERSRSQI